MVPGAVPRVEAVGDDVLRLAPAPQRDDGRERLVHGRARRDHRQITERLPLGGQPYPQEHPVVVGGEGEPIAAHPFAERQTVPAAVDLTVHDLAVVEQRPEDLG